MWLNCVYLCVIRDFKPTPIHMNEKLQEIYNSKWNELSDGLNEILKDNSKENKPTNPLLLYINEDDYKNADIKIMIFGQETNDWEGNFQNDINICLDTYDDFFNANDCFSYGGQFWNGFNRFLTLLQNEFPNKKISSVWNNVIKIGNSGRDKNYPPEYIYNIENEKFKVISSEIEILRPDIILFLSGPNYDLELKNSLNEAVFSELSEDFTERKLAKIKYKNYKNVFRTYHPNYLWRNGIDTYFNEIIKKIEI